jgi:hypothetical protein
LGRAFPGTVSKATVMGLAMNADVSQGSFNVTRLLDGSLRFMGPPCFIVSPQSAVQIAKAILAEAGVTVVFADPGQTVIRPPGHYLQKGNGNGQS